MNPYRDFSELLFSCVNASPHDTATFIAARFNQPDKDSNWPRYPDRTPIPLYFVQEIPFRLSEAYVDRAERDGRQPRRIILWKPLIAPEFTVIMERSWEGMMNAVEHISKESPWTWINIKDFICEEYPSSQFSYYSAF